jgi:hypothetical protein
VSQAYELPAGYQLASAAPQYELPKGYSLAEPGMKDAPNQPPENPDFEVGQHSATASAVPPFGNQAGSGPSEDFLTGLLTNQPIQGMAGTLGRSLPTAVLSLGGGGPAGAAAGEALRQAVVSTVATAHGEQPPTLLDAVGRPIFAAGLQQAGELAGPYLGKALVGGTVVPSGSPLLTPGTHIIGDELGGIAGAIASGAQAVRGGLNRIGAGVMKVAANVNEKSGLAALSDLRILSRAPSNEAVSEAYDAFHAASGTVSRKEFLSKSGDPFDGVARAKATMLEAAQRLKDGTLTHQEAVNASQAGRLIRDLKLRGNEMAQEIAETAADLKGKFDDFIQSSLAPRTVMKNVPFSQNLTERNISEEVGHKIIHGTVKAPVAQELVQTGVSNVPTQETSDILPQLKSVVQSVRSAKANGLAPGSLIQGDAERRIFDQFRVPILAAAEHNVPIESLLTGSEVSPTVSAFSEQPIYGPGKMIYADKPAVFPGEPIRAERTVFAPGDVVTRARVVSENAGRPGFPEWQQARQMAFENHVAEDLGSVFARNVNGSPNVLRTVAAMQGGAVTGGTIGAALAGPPGALVGGVIGGIGGLTTTSPLAYGTLIKGAGYASRLLPSGEALSTASKFGAQATSALTPLAAQALSHMSPESISAFYRSPGVTP